MHTTGKEKRSGQVQDMALVSCNANTLHNSGAFLRHAALRRLAMTPAMTRCRALPDTKNHSEFTFANFRYRTLAQHAYPETTLLDTGLSQACHRIACQAPSDCDIAANRADIDLADIVCG